MQRFACVMSVLAAMAVGCNGKDKPRATDPDEGGRVDRAPLGDIVVAQRLPPGALPRGAAQLPAEAPLVFEVACEVTGVTSTCRTQGLVAHGWPELELPDLPPSAYVPGAEELLTATAHTLARGGLIDANSVLHAEPSLVPDERATFVPLPSPPSAQAVQVWLDRRAPDRLALLFPGSRAGVHERQARAFATILGNQDDDKAASFATSPAIDAAMAKAQAELRALAPRFAQAVPAGEELTIDAPFDAVAAWEYLPVQVTQIVGDEIRGIVMVKPSPEVATVREGSRVVVKLADVLDYEHVAADGTVTGGEVNALIEALDPAPSDEPGAPPAPTFAQPPVRPAAPRPPLPPVTPPSPQ